MIVEGIVTTVDLEGATNVAPMGPLTDPDLGTLVLRPFKSSRTYQNLRRVPEGVFHVTDDVELLARSCLETVCPPMRPARHVRGQVITTACRAYEFRVTAVDDREERARVDVEVLHRETFREFLGFNRAKHAVVEAAILASRLGIIESREILTALARLEAPVAKTGGPEERRAFEYLTAAVDRALQSREPERVTVRTGSRLHLGLISPWEGPGRRHGGVGLMVEAPGCEVVARRARRLEVTGPLAQRAAEALRTLTRTRAPGSARSCPGDGAPGVALEVVRSSPEHTGLGTGTQLSLAAARAAAELLGMGPLSVDSLARATGRGRRSAIGSHGFERGGLLVDGGHGAGTDSALAPLVSRLEVPEHWAMLIVLPRTATRVAGRREREAFDELETAMPEPSGREDISARLCRTVLMALLPALRERDFTGFSRAVWELQRRVGEIFAAAQGGLFASAEVEEIIRHLRRSGVEGTGQSSWGPCVFGFVRDPEEARDRAHRLREVFDLPAESVVTTRALNRGARISRAWSVPCGAPAQES